MYTVTSNTDVSSSTTFYTANEVELYLCKEGFLFHGIGQALIAIKLAAGRSGLSTFAVTLEDIHIMYETV